MKKMLLPLLFAAASVPAQAYYIGSVGKPFGRGGQALELIYDAGAREIEPSNGGQDVDMDTNRLYFQYTRGLGNGLEFFGRVMPETGEADFDPGNFNPDLWGLGGGVRWSPKQKGAFKLGFQFSLDWNQGDDQNTDIDIKEILFAGGGSYRVNRNVDVYGGLSLLKSDITVEPPAGPDQDWENGNTFGLFGGLDLKPGKNFTVGLELRLVNETIFAVSGRMKF